MITCVKDGYIVAFSPSGENDTDYEEAKEIFNNHGDAEAGYTWMMRDDMTMVQVEIPVDSSADTCRDDE